MLQKQRDSLVRAGAAERVSVQANTGRRSTNVFMTVSRREASLLTLKRRSLARVRATLKRDR